VWKLKQTWNNIVVKYIIGFNVMQTVELCKFESDKFTVSIFLWSGNKYFFLDFLILIQIYTIEEVTIHSFKI